MHNSENKAGINTSECLSQVLESLSIETKKIKKEKDEINRDLKKIAKENDEIRNKTEYITSKINELKNIQLTFQLTTDLKNANKEILEGYLHHLLQKQELLLKNLDHLQTTEAELIFQEFILDQLLQDEPLEPSENFPPSLKPSLDHETNKNTLGFLKEDSPRFLEELENSMRKTEKEFKSFHTYENKETPRGQPPKEKKRKSEQIIKKPKILIYQNEEEICDGTRQSHPSFSEQNFVQPLITNKVINESISSTKAATKESSLPKQEIQKLLKKAASSSSNITTPSNNKISVEEPAKRNNRNNKPQLMKSNTYFGFVNSPSPSSINYPCQNYYAEKNIPSSSKNSDHKKTLQKTKSHCNLKKKKIFENFEYPPTNSKVSSHANAANEIKKKIPHKSSSVGKNDSSTMVKEKEELSNYGRIKLITPKKKRESKERKKDIVLLLSPEEIQKKIDKVVSTYSIKERNLTHKSKSEAYFIPKTLTSCPSRTTFTRTPRSKCSTGRNKDLGLSPAQVTSSSRKSQTLAKLNLNDYEQVLIMRRIKLQKAQKKIALKNLLEKVIKNFNEGKRRAMLISTIKISSFFRGKMIQNFKCPKEEFYDLFRKYATFLVKKIKAVLTSTSVECRVRKRRDTGKAQMRKINSTCDLRRNNEKIKLDQTQKMKRGRSLSALKQATDNTQNKKQPGYTKKKIEAKKEEKIKKEKKANQSLISGREERIKKIEERKKEIQKVNSKGSLKKPRDQKTMKPYSKKSLNGITPLKISGKQGREMQIDTQQHHVVTISDIQNPTEKSEHQTIENKFQTPSFTLNANGGLQSPLSPVVTPEKLIFPLQMNEGSFDQKSPSGFSLNVTAPKTPYLDTFSNESESLRSSMSKYEKGVEMLQQISKESKGMEGNLKVMSDNLK